MTTGADTGRPAKRAPAAAKRSDFLQLAVLDGLLVSVTAAFFAEADRRQLSLPARVIVADQRPSAWAAFANQEAILKGPLEVIAALELGAPAPWPERVAALHSS